MSNHLVARAAYRALLREARRLDAAHAALTLAPPVDVRLWGTGRYVPARSAGAVQAALFPGAPFAAAGLGDATTIDGAAVRALARHAFRHAPPGAPLDSAFAHLATLNRLRAAEACTSVTRTTVGDDVAVDVELTTTSIATLAGGASGGGGADAEPFFPFAYRVRVANAGAATIQVIGRGWRFEDAAGRVVELPRGSPGIVGASPVLEPGQAYEYVSGTQLATPTGSMRGALQFVRAPGSDVADAVVARTALSGPRPAAGLGARVPGGGGGAELERSRGP